jgi:hypothetical protein
MNFQIKLDKVSESMEKKKEKQSIILLLELNGEWNYMIKLMRIKMDV